MPRYQSDIPDNEPRARAGTIRQRVDDTSYLIDFSDTVGLPEIAVYSGTGALTVGQRVQCFWHPELRHWRIDAIGLDQPTLSVTVQESADDGYWEPAGATFDSTSTTVAVGSTPHHAFILFRNVEWVNAATVPAAYLYLDVLTTTGGQVTVDISAEDADSGTAPTTVGGADGLTLTTASASWAIPSAATARAKSTAITAVIQEVVDRAGWASGNDILLVLEYSSGGSTSFYGRWSGATPAEEAEETSIVARLYIGDPLLDPLATVDAADVTYTPATSSDWDVAPIEVASALDELASRVTALEP